MEDGAANACPVSDIAVGGLWSYDAEFMGFEPEGAVR